MSKSPTLPDIVITGAHEHNLRHVSLTIPRNNLTVVTGVSGSGKSSLAFDTLYAEGQRRYVESLSSYARQFLDQMSKPKVENITGLSPAISIEQKTVSKNPRSTVGTVTEIYDYLRVLYANLGQPSCAHCGLPLGRQTVQQIVDTVLGWPEGTRVVVLAPVVRGRKGEYKQIFEQAQREGYTRVKVDGKMRLLEDGVVINKKLKHDISIVVARLIVADKIRDRLTDSVETALKKAEGLVTIERLPDRPPEPEPPAAAPRPARRTVARTAPEPREEPGEEITFSLSMSCPVHGPQLVELSPRMFSFNSPFGACPACNGLGRLNELDHRRVIVDESLSIKQGAIAPWSGYFKALRAGKRAAPDAENEAVERPESGGGWTAQWVLSVLENLGVDADKPWRDLKDEHRQKVLFGSGDRKLKIVYESASGSRFETNSVFEGVIPRLERRLKEIEAEDADDLLGRYYIERPCAECGGMRLKHESLAVTLKGMNISEFCARNVADRLEFIKDAEWSARESAIGAQPLKEIRDRLEFMSQVGLDYLTLDRPAATLAGGEGQRIRLATQLGSQLVGALYVLDEPSIGLHPRDNDRLIGMLKKLRDLGNTVVVVEHDEAMIRAADWVVDLGPGAGRLGGHLVAVGRPRDIEKKKDSLTGQYLSGKRRTPAPAAGERRKPQPGRELVIRGAREHNLKNLTVRFPLGLFLCVTGVSGSGKSTLVNDILHARLAEEFFNAKPCSAAHDGLDGLDLIDKVIAVDQSPIGRTPRSNPATYTNLFSDIRDLFAQLPESRVRGYKPGRFSFNVKGGRCEVCRGDGMIKVEMHFLPDVFVRCEACGGRRFNRETLEILYRGKSIADALEMTVEEALEFFTAIPALRRRLTAINEVGLGYIHLGQSATTLSGGEAQRMKLAKELGRRGTGSTLYIFDEPTTGLHFEDVRKLIEVLARLVEEGNTVIVIEHNLDVMRSADWILDLGPEGGDGGGELVAEGPPEAIALIERSRTGRSLAPAL